jgi:quercetin dioxygenase-like cupin family protein
MAVENGDPSKGPSVIVFKGTAGCVIPWHWHTPTEQVMIISGSAKVEMKGGATSTLGPGGYVMMPSKHVHQFTCASAMLGFCPFRRGFRYPLPGCRWEGNLA